MLRWRVFLATANKCMHARSCASPCPAPVPGLRMSAGVSGAGPEYSCQPPGRQGRAYRPAPACTAGRYRPWRDPGPRRSTLPPAEVWEGQSSGVWGVGVSASGFDIDVGICEMHAIMALLWLMACYQTSRLSMLRVRRAEHSTCTCRRRRRCRAQLQAQAFEADVRDICCCCCCHHGRTFLDVLMTKPPAGPSSSWSGHHTRLPGSFFFFRAGPPAPATATASELLGPSPAAPSSVSRSRRISESETPRQRLDPEPRAASFADAAVPDAPALVSSSSSAHHTQGQEQGRQLLATSPSPQHT